MFPACLWDGTAIYYQKIVYNISRRLLSPSYITLIIYIYKYKIIAYYSFLCYRCNFCMLTKSLQKKKNAHVIMRNHTYAFFFIYYTPSTLSYYYLSPPQSKQDNSTPIYIYSACHWGLAFGSWNHSFPFNIRTTLVRCRKRGAVVFNCFTC